MIRRLALGTSLALASLVAGCGGTSVDGTVQGHSLSPGDTVAFRAADPSTTPRLEVQITSFGGSCGLLAQNQTRANATVLAFSVPTVDGTYAITGDYTIGNGPGQVSATFDVTDGSCTSTIDVDAYANGTISITSSDSTSVSGTFDVGFGADQASDRLKGSFHASGCNFQMRAAQPACQQ
jgi:hypothetical protein